MPVLIDLKDVDVLPNLGNLPAFTPINWVVSSMLDGVIRVVFSMHHIQRHCHSEDKPYLFFLQTV